MHVKILLKIRALNVIDARETVEKALHESVKEGNPTGWDYVGGFSQVVKIVSDDGTEVSLGKFKSYKELEEHWHGCTLKNLKSQEKQIEELLFVQLAGKHMPQKEAPLYLERKGVYGEIRGLPEIIEKKLKSNKSGIKLPQTYEEMIHIFSSAMVDEAKRSIGMIMHYLKGIQKISDYLEYKEPDTALQSTNIHFADISADEKVEGEKVFYFICDRHC